MRKDCGPSSRGYHGCMRRWILWAVLGAALNVGAAQAPAPEKKPAKPGGETSKPATGIATVKKVYLLPMRASLDQYLASYVTSQRIFEVVADPKRADAIFTDRLGESFEKRVSELLKEKDQEAAKTETPRGEGMSASRTAGTIFLVEPKSMTVLWSVYQPPKNLTREEVDACARRIVRDLATEKGTRKKRLGIF